MGRSTKGVNVKTVRDGVTWEFPSMQQAAKFLSEKVFLSVRSLEKYMTNRRPNLCGWRIFYEEPEQSSEWTCSDECKEKLDKKRRPYRKASLTYREKSRRKTIDDYEREAAACGLSYGQYKVQLKLGKTFSELKQAYEDKNLDSEAW